MTKKTIENILEIYDTQIDQKKAMREISKAFGLSKEEVIGLLVVNERDVPYGKKTKDEETKAPDPAADRPLPIPKFVFEVLAEKMETIDGQIKELESALDILNGQYGDISGFIKDYKQP